MIQSKLITPELLKKLDLLQVLSKKVIRGTIKGERTSSQRGRSVEFADYRNYVPGDEIRIIDWNIYGRLDKLFVKLFVEEEELTMYLLIDRSLSMGFGVPPKIDYARKIAAALSYISLSNFDRVAAGLVDTSFNSYQAPVRGKNQVFRIFEYLEKVKPQGGTSLTDGLKQFALRKLRPGLTIVISDFLDPGDFIESLKYLLYQKQELFLIQVLDSEEIEPSIGGDIKLVDVETGSVKEVTVTEKLLSMYKGNFAEHNGMIESFCKSFGVGFLPALTSTPFEDLVLRYFRKGRLLH